MTRWISSTWLLGVLFAALSAGSASAQFTQGNIVVERLGNGSAALTSAATAGFLDQYSAVTANQLAPTFTVALPTTAGTLGGPLAVTASGTAASEGFLSRTNSGTTLLAPGYNADAGTANVATTVASATFRSLAGVGLAGTVNSNNGFNNGTINGNIRGLASLDGSSFYITTNQGVFQKFNTGTVENATQLVTNNTRTVQIVNNGGSNNSLFVSTSSATPTSNGIFLVGNVGTLPTGTTTVTQLPGLGASGTGTPSAYGFVLFNNPLNTNNWNGTNLNTLYTADDRTLANGGGIQRWVYDGTNWNVTANVAPGTVGLRGLTGSITGSTVTLLGTTQETAANSLVTITDVLTPTTGAFGAFTTLAIAPTNTIFRGVAFSPVPEPGAVLAACFAGLGVVGWLRRRKPGALN